MYHYTDIQPDSENVQRFHENKTVKSPRRRRVKYAWVNERQHSKYIFIHQLHFYYNWHLKDMLMWKTPPDVEYINNTCTVSVVTYTYLINYIMK